MLPTKGLREHEEAGNWLERRLTHSAVSSRLYVVSTIAALKLASECADIANAQLLAARAWMASDCDG